MNIELPANASKEEKRMSRSLFFRQRTEGAEALNCEKSNIVVVLIYHMNEATICSLQKKAGGWGDL